MTQDNVLLIGPPGSGKTMWARNAAKVIPFGNLANPLIGYTYRVAGLSETTLDSPPWRAPHHTISKAGMVGTTARGGWMWKPGELSLANGGILFLDELPEFRPDVLDAVREAVMTGFVTYPNFRVPTAFRLIAAMNPCPCGWQGTVKRECQCPERAVKRYLEKVPKWLRDACKVVELGMPPAVREVR